MLYWLMNLNFAGGTASTFTSGDEGWRMLLGVGAVFTFLVLCGG
jgi:hypothetical protein